MSKPISIFALFLSALALVNGECWIAGRCQGVLLDISQPQSKEECLDACQNLPECAWFSFDTSSSSCSLFQTCLTLDDSCSVCVSGESSCADEGDTKLLVVSGDANYNDTEWVELSQWPSSACSKPEGLPDPRYGAALITDDSQYPLICGGRIDQTFFNDCLTFSYQSNDWAPSPLVLSKSRWSASSVMVDANQWWITGGFDGDSKLNNSDLFQEGQFRPGPALMEGVFNHCTVQLPDGSTILSGGYSDSSFASNKTWRYDWTSQVWSPLPDLAFGRGAHACGRTPDGRIFVAGGDWIGGGDLISTEILSQDLQEWLPGPDLPFGVMRGVSLEFGAKYLIVGGYWDGEANNGLLAFDGAGWTVMNQTLSEARQWHGALLAPESLLELCD
eukprot:maker-scaffold20_size707684-snap-gene-3.17 protein:Tk03847 transcript:maker-scaffold20_size707684-snap-gene-3.17-mRNA-1 annotation:"high-affinity leucine-specific transport periplasmic binding protein"